MKILKNSKYNIIKKDHQCNEDEEKKKKILFEQICFKMYYKDILDVM